MKVSSKVTAHMCTNKHIFECNHAHAYVVFKAKEKITWNNIVLIKLIVW